MPETSKNKENEKDTTLSMKNEEKNSNTKQEKIKKKWSKRKKLLVICSVILGILVVLLPLATMDYKDISSLLFGTKREDDVVYYEPNYEENIFENEEYLSHVGRDLSVTLTYQNPYSISYDFHDMESARKAFSHIGEKDNGGKVLENYFLSLLEGANSVKEADRFHSLFTEEGKKKLPSSFPSQKIYNIDIKYYRETVEDGKIYHEWHIQFDVVRNDGTVLNYNNVRDSMNTRFLILEKSSGEFYIDKIIGINQMN